MTQGATFDDGRDGNEDRGDDRLIGEAADWLVRLTSGTATAADAEALAEWRAQSGDHDAAFRQLAGMPGLARALGTAPAAAPSRRAVLAGGATLVAVAAIGLARPPLALWPSLAELLADHRTGPGERYAFTPIAGVAVEMNSRTSLSLIEHGRGIALIDGETFIAATNPVQPFTVTAGAHRITAARATFDVQSLGDTLRVACASGTIDCTSGDTVERVRAGEQLVQADGQVTRSAVDPDKATAWRRGLLIFDGTPLKQVVEQINLYRPGRIMLTSETLGHRSVSGVFHIDRIDNTITQIQQALGLQLRHLPGGVLLMG